MSSKRDSHTIIDQNGADSLLRMSDMFYSLINSYIPIRIHDISIRN
ncbi:MAG: hypothetical protein ACTS78_00525 [Arsenophonus sp. NC-WZS1-MAG3]